VNRHFQTKHAKYSNFHIIKTTEAILTNFCKVIKTTKYTLQVIPKFAPQIQDGGRPTFWKTLNVIFLQPFDWFQWHLVWWCTFNHNIYKNFKIWNPKMANSRHSKRWKNCNIFKSVWPILLKFCNLTHIGLPDLSSGPFRCSNYNKTKMADGRHFEDR